VPELSDPLLHSKHKSKSKRLRYTQRASTIDNTLSSHSFHHNFHRMKGSSSTMRASSFGGATLPPPTLSLSSSPSPSPSSDRASSSRSSSPLPSTPSSHHREQQQQQQHPPLHDIEDPTENDVLSGRGVTTNKHPGNVNFRSLVSLNKVSKVPSSLLS
jgi:hypothetical protein